MEPRTDDERQLVLSRIVKDLARLRSDASNAGCDFLAYMLAQSQNEAETQLAKLEGETFTD